MENLIIILNYIGRTNLFNFFIFAGVIIFVLIKLDVLGKFDSAICDIKNRINSSENDKTKSINLLEDIEKNLADINFELDKIAKSSKQNADIVANNILSEADKVLDNLKDNAEKVKLNSLNILKNEIKLKAALVSVNVAKNYIVDELNNNLDLHYKLIDESLNSFIKVDEAGL